VACHATVHLFKKFDMKGFSIEDKDKAIEFLTNTE